MTLFPIQSKQCCSLSKEMISLILVFFCSPLHAIDSKNEGDKEQSKHSTQRESLEPKDDEQGFSDSLLDKQKPGSYVDYLTQWVPERRSDQTRTSRGHILTPAIANIPGLGFFYGLIGGLFNIFGSESDVFSYLFWGQVKGKGLGIVEMPAPWTEKLTFNLFYNIYDQANFGIHKRTIFSSDQDVINKKLAYYRLILAQMNYRLLDRRLQLNAGVNSQVEEIDGYYDHQGHKFSHHTSRIGPNYNLSFGVIGDLSDDRSDPRKGLIFEAFRYERQHLGSIHADYYNIDYNLLYHVPVFTHSTWVFNAYRSDSSVRLQGSRSKDAIKESLDLNCDDFVEAADKERCQYYENHMIEDKILENTYGTSLPIGGTQRLQAYQTNRFQGAHSQTFGSELRVNLTQEFSPFNIGILSGIRTGVQIAAFYEKGIAVDQRSLLADLSLYKPSYGGGIRFLLASGFVIRLDLAMGDEGRQPIIIFQYPWNVF